MKKITKTALILAESLLVASNSYADDSEGFQSTVIQCGAVGTSTSCGGNTGVTDVTYPLKSASTTVRGNGEVKVRMVKAKASTTYAVYEGVWDGNTPFGFTPGLLGASDLGCAAYPFKALGTVTSNATGKVDGKILVSTAPNVYYSIPNGTKQSVVNFAINDVANNCAAGTVYVTGIKVDAINDPAD